MTHNTKVSISKTLIGLFCCAAFVAWLCGCETNASPQLQKATFNVTPKDLKLLKQSDFNDFIVHVNGSSMFILATDSQTTRVYLDIDPDEARGMSTDSLHPDAALMYRGKDGVPHVSYNYGK